MSLPIVLDAFDHRLLDLLQGDAGRTLTALGEAVGLSPSAVQRRIKRYRAHGLLRQVAVLDAEAFPSVVLATVWVTMERESVRQLNDTQLHWIAEIAGVHREWDATIVDQVPDDHIQWRSTSGADNAGTVSFKPLGADRTEVTLALTFEPEGVVEKAGDVLGIVQRRTRGDLENFKEMIEDRGQATGAWRGEV